jgi:hypothetical protein
MRKDFPDRRARAIAALSRFKGETAISTTLRTLLNDTTPVILSQKTLQGIWPFRGLDWTTVEPEIRDFAYAAIVEIEEIDSDYEYGDGAAARAVAISRLLSGGRGRGE